MNCLLCGRLLREGNREDLGSPPSEHVLFYTRGSADSRAYRPDDRDADREHLVVAVCDPCLAGAGEQGLVLHEKLQTFPGMPFPGEWETRQWRTPDGRLVHNPGKKTEQE